MDITTPAFAFGAPVLAAPASPTVAVAAPPAPQALENPMDQLVPLNGRYSLTGTLHPGLSSTDGNLAWTPPVMSARQETRISRRESVKQARAAERSSEHISGGIDRKADMVVGAQLRVVPQPDWELLNDASGGALTRGDPDWKRQKEFARSCMRWFRNWADDPRKGCDTERHYNFGGLMWQAARNLEGPDAETIGVIHYDDQRRQDYGFAWATHVSVVDPDRLSTPASRAGDPKVVDGVQLDAFDAMIGLWIAKKHPAEGADEAETHAYAPRESNTGRPMAWHFFIKRRGHQIRGMTSLIASLRHNRMLDQFDDHQLGAAAINAMLAPAIKTQASTGAVRQGLVPAGDPGDLTDQRLGFYKTSNIRLGFKRIPLLFQDDELVQLDLARTIADPTGFRNNFLRAFAMALGISFEQLSNNFSDANYSAARAALLEVWRGIKRQRLLFTAAVAQQCYVAVIEEGIARGYIKLPPGAPSFLAFRAAWTQAKWTGPGMGWIDPLKEMKAWETALRMKVTSRERIAAMDGDDIIEIFDELEHEQHAADERDLDLSLETAAAPAEAEDEETDEKPPAARPASGETA